MTHNAYNMNVKRAYDRVMCIRNNAALKSFSSIHCNIVCGRDILNNAMSKSICYRNNLVTNIVEVCFYAQISRNYMGF